MEEFDDDDEFFGDAFDDVPVNAIQTLEKEALAQSQRQKRDVNKQQRDEQEVFDGENGVEVNVNLGQEAFDASHHVPNPASSDYGLDDDEDEDVIDLDDPTVTFSKHAAPFPARSCNGQILQQRSHSDLIDNVQIQEMEDRIGKYEQETLRLNRALKDLQEELMTKNGAISNLRSRMERSNKEHENRIAELQKAQMEERALLKTKVQDAQKHHETTKVSNRFLEHELAEERQRIKKAKQDPSISERQVFTKKPVTPRKVQTSGLADGFDDDEMTSPSPSKAKTNGRAITPRLGQKRKRVEVVESPRSAVASPPVSYHSPPRAQSQSGPLHILPTASLSDRKRSKIIKLVLNHRFVGSTTKTIQVLANMQLQSQKDSTLATPIFDAIARLQLRPDINPSTHIREICLDIWEKCLGVPYWQPLPFIVDLINVMLSRESSSERFELFDRLLPLALKTSAPTAERRVQSGKKLDDMQRDSEEPATDDIDILKMLRLIAIAAADDSSKMDAFWARIEFKYVILMLSKGQPISHMHIILQMLAVSVSDNAIGPRHFSPEIKITRENQLLDKLSALLLETPGPEFSSQDSQYGNTTTLRLQILRTIRVISTSQHGYELLCRHRMMLGRLMRFLCVQVTSIHETPIDIDFEALSIKVDSPKHPSIREETIASINLTTRILYHLLHYQDIDLKEKLSVIPGGNQKFLIAFSRLAFSDRSFFDAGLDDEVIDAAREILDSILNPEEIEAMILVMDNSRTVTTRQLTNEVAETMDEDAT